MVEHETVRFLPPHWAEDDFSEAMGQAFANVLGSFVRLKKDYELCHRVDRAFFKVATHMLEPKDLLAPFLVMRSHSAYRAACQLAMAGQAVEAFPVLRLCLECSLYALHINRNPGFGEIWLRRGENEASKQLCRKNFQLFKVLKTLEKWDRRLYPHIKILYERTIDFGAHPNEMAVTGSMQILREANRVEVPTTVSAQRAIAA